MGKKEIQNLHIKISIYQYSIILFLSLFGVLFYFIYMKTAQPYFIQSFGDYPFYKYEGIFKGIIKIIFGLSALSIILRFIPDTIFRKHIFRESFAIRVTLDYFIRVIVIAISFLCAIADF